MNQGCSRWTRNLKVSLLTLLVLGSFIMSTIGWRHIETNRSTQVITGGLILIFMYVLMIFECVNRTLAALIGAAMSVAACDCLIEHSTIEEILDWEDLETLSLLFGMMIVVSVLSSTGLFDYLAIWSYKKSNGKFWLLVYTISLLTSVLSAFIDNVSTMLLMSPTLIKLSELEHIDPRYILIIMCLASNIGGTATPIGDPPNLIIIGDDLVKSLGISFGRFTAYCSPGVLFALIAMLIYLRVVYKTKQSFRVQSETQLDENSSLHRQQNEAHNGDARPSVSLEEHRDQVLDELRMLTSFKDQMSRLENSKLSPKTLEMLEQVVVQTHNLETTAQELNDSLSRESCKQQDLSPSFSSIDHYNQRRSSRLNDQEIAQLLQSHKIKSWPILIQCSAVLLGAVVLFFANSLPGTNLTLGWISLFAGLTLLTLSSATKLSTNNSINKQEDSFDAVINDIEWSTLIFFFALFIVMEAMSKLGLIGFMGQQIADLIDLIPVGSARSIGAISIILWSSAIASAFVDNVPFTTMMVKVLGTLLSHARSSDSDIELKPLVFALAFGSCFGGNGSLIGASANLVTAGISKRYGYPITFVEFFKFSAPITILTLVLTNVYLVIVFVILQL